MIVLHPLRKPSWTGSAASKVTNRNTNKNQVKSNAPLPKARELLTFALPFFVIPRAPLAAYSSLFLRPPACDPPDPSPLFSRDRRLMDFPSYSTSKDQARIYNDWFSFADSGSLPHPSSRLCSRGFWGFFPDCIRWRWPDHGERCHQVLLLVESISPRSQTGETVLNSLVPLLLIYFYRV